MVRPGRLDVPTVAMMAVGGEATVGQLVLLRELVVVSYGNELTLGLILAGWMAWTAGGAWGAGRLAVRHLRLMAMVRGGLAIAAVLLPSLVVFVRIIRRLMGVTPGMLLSPGPTLLLVSLSLAPACLLLGGLFALCTRWATECGGSVGRSYAAESAGSVAGGVYFIVALSLGADPFQVVLLSSVPLLAVAVWPGGLRPVRPGWRWLAIAVLGVLSLPVGRGLNLATLRCQYGGLLFAGDSVYGRVVVVGRGRQRIFFENGLLMFETQGVASEEAAHLPLLAHPAPRRVLLVGGGIDGTLAEVLHHPTVQDVQYVELDPLLITAARATLPPTLAAALDDPRVTLVHADGRVYVEQQGGRRAFDVVVLGVPEPSTGQLNRFYTREFFVQVRALLTADGVLALSMPWQENYASLPLRRLASSIYHTLAAEFPNVAILPAERLWLLAADRPLPADPATWQRRLVRRGLRTRWVTREYLRYLLTTDRIAQTREILDEAATQLNSDAKPISYFYDLMVWLSLFHVRLGMVDARTAAAFSWGVVVLLAVVVVLSGRWAVAAVIALAGLIEMTLEVVLLFAFQLIHGSLYGLVGLIVTSFMAGLAIGGLLADWSLRRWQRSIWLLRIALLAMSGYALLLYPMVTLRPPTWVFALLALAAGGVTGAAFPPAAAVLSGERAEVAGVLYGADLLGGCIGAVMGGAILVPTLGLPATCLAAALMGGAALIALR